MKKLIFLFATVLLCISGFAQKNTNITINAGGLFSGAVALNIETKTKEKQSLNFKVGFKTSNDYLVDYLGDNTINTTNVEEGFFINPEYRFYLSKKKEGMQGFYVAGNAIFRNFVSREESVTSVGAGTHMGLQWQVFDRMIIDWNMLGIRLDGDVAGDSGNNGLNFTSGLSLGVAF